MTKNPSPHEQVADNVARVHTLLPAWRAAPGGTELADALEGLGAALAPHLDDEERLVLPLVREHEAASFLRRLPLPVRLVWRLAGHRRYCRHMSLVTGSMPS